MAIRTAEGASAAGSAALALGDYPALSVQYHPEASPGPQDSCYLFGKFVTMLP